MPAAQSTKSRNKVVVICAVVIAVLMVCAVMAIRGSGVETEMAKLRASGLPVRVEDLNAWYPAVAEESNAALSVLAAVELREEDAPPNMQMPARGKQTTARHVEEIGAYVGTNAHVIRTLRAGLQLPESRYPITVTGTMIANAIPNADLGEIKSLAQLLHYETVHLVSQGTAESAFAPVRDGFAIAATLRNEPFLISELVRIACSAIAIRSLECALPEGEFDDEQLRELAGWLDRTETDCSRSWHRAIVGERTIGLQYFTTIAQTVANATSAWDEFRGTLYRGLGFHDRDLRLYLEMMARLSTAITNSFPKAYQESVALGQELTNRFSSGLARFASLSQGILPAMIKATGKEAALVTSLRCARAAISIERYRLAHDGKLPDDLQQLVPTYLAEVPRDGAVGEMIQFEQIKGGYQLSSPAAATLLDNKMSTAFPVVRWKFEGN
ncbi:MAG: hypothetical protein ACXW3Z_03635 [Limisphaerales bacterium]